MGANVRLRDDIRACARNQNGGDFMNPNQEEYQVTRNPSYVSGLERFAITLVFFSVGLVIGFFASVALLEGAK